MRRYDPLIDHQKILGSTFVNALNDKDHALLRDGKNAYTKHQLVMQFGTGNFLAARRLAVQMQAMKMKSIMEFFSIPPQHLGEIHGFGTTMIYVLICIGKAKGVDIKQWYKEGVSFATIKHKAMADEREERRTSKAREKRRRTDALHAAGSHVIAKAEKAGTNNVQRFAKSA